MRVYLASRATYKLSVSAAALAVSGAFGTFVMGPTPASAESPVVCDNRDLECKVRTLADKDIVARRDTDTGGWSAAITEAPAAEPLLAPQPVQERVVEPPRPTSPAILRRPQNNTETMAAGPGRADAACQTTAPAPQLPFAVTVDGKSVDGSAIITAAGSQQCVDAALLRAEVQIRYDGLNNEPRLNVVAAPDAALKGEGIVFKIHSNYALKIARGEIRIFAKGTTTQQSPLAVVAVEGGGAQWTVPHDIALQIRQRLSLKDSDTTPIHAPLSAVNATPKDGPRDSVLYVLRVYDAEGRFDETSVKTLDLVNLRGGHSNPKELLSVYNGNALDVRNIPISGGSVLVSGRNVPSGHTVKVLGIPAPVDDNGNFAIRQLLTPGEHQVDVAIANAKGVASVFERGVVIPKHDFFYVALADLTAGKNATTGPAALLNPEKTGEYQDKIFINGRMAFYFKGKVSGDTLITAAADTREQPIKSIFSNFDSKDPTYLLRNLDPNKYYPVYGDDSTLAEDAPTRGKFYVRIERGDSSVVWGNFKTSITGTEFVRYDRGLYGARAQTKTAETTGLGERRGTTEVFAAEPGTLGARDVFLGTGGSVYYVSRQNITQGSERISVEVRDRNTGLVLQTRTLAAAQDYDINYLQGRVALHTPLASTGTGGMLLQSGGLGGTQQYLVVTYEYAPGLTATTDKVVGGRSSYWINDHVQVGVTGYDQTTPGEAVKIIGSDVTIRATPGTYIKLEGARSNGRGSGENVSADGGFTFTPLSTSGQIAYAKRVEAAADLAEIITGSQGRIAGFWKDKDRDYSGPGELAINSASRQMGASGEVKLNQRWSEKTKVDGTQDQFRNYASAEQNVTYTFNDHWKGTAGARLDNNKVINPSASPTLNQNGERLDVALRADFDPKSNWTGYSYVQGTAVRTGERDPNNRAGLGGTLRLTEKLTGLAEVSQGNGGLGGKIGTDYKIDEKRSSYLNYSLTPDRTDIISRGGAGIITTGTRDRFSDTVSVFGEEKLRYGGGYSGLTHAFGLDLVPVEHWKTGVALETGKLSDPFSGDIQRNAVSTSAGYAHAGLAYSGKYEFRHDHATTTTTDTVRDTFLMQNGLSHKVTPDWRLIGKINGSYSTSTQGDFVGGNYLEAVSGIAYRPIGNDRINALFKYTYFYDAPSPSQIAAANGAGSFSQRSNVLSVDAAYDLNTYVTVGAKYAFRIGSIQDNIAGGAWFESRANLLIGRIDYHIISQWDLTGELRLLSESNAGDMRAGTLFGIYRHLNDNFKLGAGYNFTNYTDDLTNMSYRNRGVFVNAVGKF